MFHGDVFHDQRVSVGQTLQLTLKKNSSKVYSHPAFHLQDPIDGGGGTTFWYLNSMEIHGYRRLVDILRDTPMITGIPTTDGSTLKLMDCNVERENLAEGPGCYTQVVGC